MQVFKWLLVAGMLASLLGQIAGSPTCPCEPDPTDQYYNQLGNLAMKNETIDLSLNAADLSTALNDIDEFRDKLGKVPIVRSAESISRCDDHCRDRGISSTSLNIGDTLCTWTYECDYDQQRLPAFMFHANCSSTWHLDETNTADPRKCQPINHPILVLRTTGTDQFDKDGEWTWVQESVTVGCTASRNRTSS